MTDQQELEDALILAARWQDIRSDEGYGQAGKSLGVLARALLKLRERSAVWSAPPEENTIARQILDRLTCELGGNHVEVLAFAQKLGAFPSPLVAPHKDELDSPFKPTHRHKEGGIYEMRAMLKMHVGGQWLPAVLYRNEHRAQFVREIHEFYRRFDAVEPPAA